MAHLEKTIASTEAPNIGFVGLPNISPKAARKLRKWFGTGAKTLDTIAATQYDRAVTCTIELSALAHAFTVSKLQEAVLEIYTHVPDQMSPKERKLPTEILRKMWKVTMEGCPAREFLLHLA